MLFYKKKINNKGISEESLMDSLNTSINIPATNIKQQTYCSKYHTMGELYYENKLFFDEEYKFILDFLKKLDYKHDNNF